MTLKRVDLYTDGACIGNPGPGGYAAILDYKGARKELTGGARLTTNNRMELLAVITGLEALKEACAVRVTSDSEYVINGIQEGWAKKWRANLWRKSDKTRALNSDLWARLLHLCEVHTVDFEWVRGHNGHAENERCDLLALQAAKGWELPADDEYEAIVGRPLPLPASKSADSHQPAKGQIARFIDPSREQYELSHWRNRKRRS
jgi:ribonuclease HI